MRADRLLSLMMLLQTRGKMTAAELADKLEVSERTIYRDIDALGSAGVPVYAETGRGGGFDILESYRTNLNALNESEIQAFFMLSIPTPFTELEIGQDLHKALLKLSATLPDTRKSDEKRIRQRFHLDSTWWRQAHEPIPHLQTLEFAVWTDRQLVINYRPYHITEIELIVNALGLVAKAGVWYFVFSHQGRERAIRVSSLRDVKMTDDSFERPHDFDLESFWQSWCAEREKNASNFRVSVRVASHFIEELPFHFGDRIKNDLSSLSNREDLDDIIIELRFESQEAARASLLSLGNGVEVLEPVSLRCSIQDYAQQILAVYGKT